MKIKHIWLSAIRTLNTPSQTVNANDLMSHWQALQQSGAITLGDINVFIGENGSGKSTVIDMVRALKHPEILASLPRENPPRQILPGYSISFDNDDNWSYFFSGNTFDPDLDCIENVACSQLLLIPSERKHYVRSGDLHKHALFSPVPRFYEYANIHYRNGMTLEDQFSEDAVAELNKSKPFLCSLATDRQGSFGATLIDDGTFQLGEDGRLSVWIKDDPKMPNQLPVSWLPTGWKSYALMAAWLRNCPKHAICLLEEPESHLHPKMLRFVMDSLIEIATERHQQLLISTHSATVINIAAKDKLTLFEMCGSHIKSQPDRRDILDRLGYLASDILQANCIVWVEGPSDRTYLNYWLAGRAPELVEGIHYSVMYYGGRLLSHLGVAEENEDDSEDNSADFINLQSLNRNSAILIDSDKSSAKGKLRKTKERVIKEIQANGGVAWVTKGREIENYIAPQYMEVAIKQVHRTAKRIVSQSIWANALEYKKLHARKKTVANKVKVAAKISSEYKPDYSVLDLGERIDELCTFIRKCN
ncbi:AAA family ATPase [Pseudomonas moraviensis]|uniref:ATP-dependent nuclease n=1 Tax=Pseudomonas moraviensis TaxID=321662 RepID=UPI0020938F6F|nr:AAA family ATPase [Pseudomonas moraviensis]UST56562.1 AAA family ATPase [Pseudomonas moraviensis]